MGMPEDQPVKAVAINWKKCDQINTVMGGIQLIMSNGKSSPLFLTKVQTDKNFDKVDVDFSKVRRVRGTSNSYWISQLQFQTEEGAEVALVKSYEQEWAGVQQLDEGEEIIGIYGTRFGHTQDNYMGTVGFIVWKAPK